MTETMIEAAPPEETTADDRRKKLIAAGGVGLLALAGVGYLALGRGGSSEPAPLAVAPHVVRAVVPAKAAAKPVKPVVKPKTSVLPPATSVALGRDPFKPLYIAPVAAAAGTGPATAPANPGTTPTTTGVPSGGTTATPAPMAKYPLVLRSSDASNPSLRTWTFTVNGVLKKVVTNQKFGRSGELVVLGTVTNTKGTVIGALLQVGDASPIKTYFRDRNFVL
jgi:hypothetical protein